MNKKKVLVSLVLTIMLTGSAFSQSFLNADIVHAEDQPSVYAMELNYRDESLLKDKQLIENLFKESNGKESMELYPKNNPNDNVDLGWYEKGFKKRLITESYKLNNDKFYHIEFNAKKGTSLKGIYEFFTKFETYSNRRVVTGPKMFELYRVKIGDAASSIPLYPLAFRYEEVVKEFKKLGLVTTYNLANMHEIDLSRWTSFLAPHRNIPILNKDIKMTILISPEFIKDKESGYAFVRGYQLTPFHGKQDAGAVNSRSVTYTAGASRAHVKNLAKMISSSQSRTKTTSWQNSFEAGIEGGGGINLKVFNASTKWHFTYTRVQGGSNSDSNSNSKSIQYGVGNTMTATKQKSVTKSIQIASKDETVAYAVYQPFQGMSYYKSEKFENYLEEVKKNCHRLANVIFPSITGTSLEKSKNTNEDRNIRVLRYLDHIAFKEAGEIAKNIKFTDLDDSIVYGSNNFTVIIPKSKYLESKSTVNIVDDKDSSIKYSGKWREVKESARVQMGDINNSVKIALGAENPKAAEISYTFNGYGIEVFSQAKNDCQNFNVYIDGAFHKTVDVNSNKAIDELGPLDVRAGVFKVTNLSNGKHTIRIVFKKDMDKVAVFDGFKIYSYK